MAAVTLNGLTVSVTVSDGARGDEVVVGDMARAFDGTYLRIYMPDLQKQEWHLVTTPCTQAVADALMVILRSAGPISVAGDFVRGLVLTCYGVIKGRRTVRAGVGLLEVVEFDLLEV